MPGLSEARVGAVRRLIEQVPDGAIRSLETALAGSDRADQSLALVYDIVNAEVLDRRTRSAVFAPLTPLCLPPPDALQRLAFPHAALALTWRGLKAVDPENVALAIRLAAPLRHDDETPEVFDELCRRAAEGLRQAEAAFQPLAALLDAQGPGARRTFGDALALSSLARTALKRMPTWVRTLSGEYAAAIRLAFRDAVAVSDDAGPPFMEILFGHLDEPHQVLRLISLVMDRPNDRYLAASELASFGERLLDDLDRRIEDIRRFDPGRGLEGGVALAGSVFVCTTIINEFEQWLAINREGPWGARLAANKRAMALAVEARLREVESAVGAALPTQPIRAGGKAVRGAPRLNADPNLDAVTKAQALLGFLYESRLAASYGGFGAVRNKVVETLDPKIDQYTEDMLELLHGGADAPAERIRAYLDIAAEFLGLVRDPKAAEIVRRRAAVA